MTARYIITVDRDAIDKGDLTAVVRVEYLSTGQVVTCASADLIGARITSGPMRPDGAIVWIEAEDVVLYA